jgi:hypothetical protein
MLAVSAVVRLGSLEGVLDRRECDAARLVVERDRARVEVGKEEMLVAECGDGVGWRCAVKRP